MYNGNDGIMMFLYLFLDSQKQTTILWSSMLQLFAYTRRFFCEAYEFFRFSVHIIFQLQFSFLYMGPIETVL